MYGDGSLGETAIGESPDTPLLIIPEVGLATKTLVFLVELDMLSRSSVTEPQSLTVTPMIGSVGTFDASVTLNPSMVAFSETSNEIADDMDTLASAHDVEVTIPDLSQRVLLDMAYTDRDTVSSVLDQSGAAIGLTEIANAQAGGATATGIYLLTESDMPAAAEYDLRMSLAQASQVFRQVIVLQGAHQTVSANAITDTDTDTITVSVTRASGDFPTGSKVYAVAGVGSGGLNASVSGDASFVREVVTGWEHSDGSYFAQGELASTKATASVTFDLSGNTSRLSASIAVVEPAP